MLPLLRPPTAFATRLKSIAPGCSLILTFRHTAYIGLRSHAQPSPRTCAFQISSLVPKHNPKLHVSHIGFRLQASFFSHSSALRVRNTYFPKGPSGRGSQGKDGPFSRFKRTFDALPSNVVLWTVLGLNGVVYLLWNVGIDRAQNHRDPTIITALFQNFTLSWQNWKEGRFWTLLTSCFSNQATSHIFMNALTFYWMAPPVLQILGNTSFLVLYLGGGMASSLITLYCNEMVLKQPRVVHGASGAIYAVISFMACVAPKATFMIFGIIPFPAWACVTGLFTWDALNAISQRQTGVSEISHISGILSGILYFLHKTGRIPRLF